MDPDHLESFVVLAEELHIGRAARYRHMSQSSLSRQLATLEGALGVQLAVRTTRQVRLAEAGVIFGAKSAGCTSQRSDTRTN